MGDIADWLLEQEWDDDIEDDGPRGYYRYRGPLKVTCERCRTKGLIWGKDRRGWVLVDPHTLERHTCPQAAPEEFPTI